MREIICEAEGCLHNDIKWFKREKLKKKGSKIILNIFFVYQAYLNGCCTKIFEINGYGWLGASK